MIKKIWEFLPELKRAMEKRFMVYLIHYWRESWLYEVEFKWEHAYIWRCPKCREPVLANSLPTFLKRLIEHFLRCLAGLPRKVVYECLI